MYKLFIFIVFFNLTKSQNFKSTDYIEYSLKKNKNGYSFLAKANLLIDNKNKASSFQLKKFIDISPTLENDEAINFSTRKICLEDKIYFFNFKKKSYSGLLYDVSCDNKALIENKIFFPQWKVTNKFKIIKGKKARMAIAIIEGRKWHAYYLENNLSNYGPWKIIGLNGLVILAFDEKMEYQFNLIKYIKIAKVFEKPYFLKTATQSSFVKKAIAYNKADLIKSIKKFNPDFNDKMYKKLAPYETIDFIEKK